jgi:hypothetical protein
VFLAGELLGPNARVRQKISELKQRIASELGALTLKEKLTSVLALGAALWTDATLKLNLFQHPKLLRNTYRLPSEGWAAFRLWQELQGRKLSPELSIHVELEPTREQVLMRLEGSLSGPTAEGLAQRIRDSLTRTKSRLVLDLQHLQWDKVGDLRPLREKMANYRSRIRLVLPKVAMAHPEVILLAGMFRHAIG